jgi:serine/threonine protein kinase
MADELLGKIIGGYEIQKRIGAGGMAAVYLARQQSMNRQVAIKVLPKQYMNDDTYLQRFEREVDIVSKLEHRNIVPVYDYGESEGQPYIVMRFMPAGSLDDRIQKGLLSLDEIYSVISQIAPALDYAHSKSVLHRDMKPSNVLMDDDGGAFLTDFGIARVVGAPGAKLTTQGVVGTPSYMSPEQAQGKEIDGRSDIYALGVMLFEMATGRRPFESETPYSIAVMQVTTPPPMPRKLNPALSTAMEVVILKALKKDREDRYRTASELMESLKMAIERPSLVHDTEPRLKTPDPANFGQVSSFEETKPPTRMASPSQLPSYTPPPSGVNRNAVPPSSSLRSKIRQRRKQNPLMSAFIGATIGCGLLGIIVAAAFLILGFLLPGTILQTSDSTLETGDASSFSTTEDLQAQTELPETEILRLTEDTARETLLARSSSTAIPTPLVLDTEAPLNSPNNTPQIAPVGERGTPELLASLRAVTGTIIFADLRGDTQTLEIVSLNLDTWIETQLTQDPDADNSYPVASPDGTRIAFQSNRDGDFDIYTVNLGGGDLQRLTFNTVTDRLAAWSPDGQWLVYSTDARSDEQYDLRRVRVDGSSDELLFSNTQRNSHARFSPDGRYVIFTTGHDPRDGSTWEIGRLDMETKDFALLTNNDRRDASPIFSPDGNSILYITFNPETNSNAIATMDADGDNKRIIFDYAGSEWSANYSPDGQYIIFTSNRTGRDQLYLMTADGRDVQQITSDGGLYASWIGN